MSSTVFASERAGSWFRGGAGRAARAGQSGTVAVTGFASVDEAVRAAGAAYDTQRAWLARHRRLAFVSGPRRVLKAERDARGTWLTLRGAPIGRLLEPDRELARSDGYGFELLLPPGSGPATRSGAAQVVDDALAARAAVPDHALAGPDI